MDYLEIRELYHHGIKGQKWGIRRYQNEDGSLTAEGKQRYQVNKYDGSMSKAGKKLYKKDLKLDKLSKSEKKNLISAAISGAGKGTTMGLLSGALGASTISYGMERKGGLDREDAAEIALLEGIGFGTIGAITGGLLGAIGGASVNTIKNKQIDNAKRIPSPYEQLPRGKQPWDEKPSRKQPWDEKPSKPTGRI